MTITNSRLSKEDIIAVNSWRNIADETWESGDLPKAKLIYVIPERLADFVKLVISEKCKTRYVVISAESDYGLVSQKEHPINADMTPWLKLVISQRDGDYLRDGNYEALSFPPRCIPESCRFSDTYSLKCAMFTHSTFPYIPSNLLILTTNTDLEHSQVVKIPFGIRPSTVDQMIELHDEFFDNEKQNKLYVNFTSYTLDRHSLMLSYMHRVANLRENFIVVERDLEWSEYIKHMALCRYILSPSGNGIDCYRNLEAHYIGSAPVMLAGTASSLIKIPHFELPTLHNLGQNSLVGFEKINISNWARLSKWKEAIYDLRRDY